MARIGTPADDLNANETAFLGALLTERTVGDAAEKVGISKRTAFRYLDEPAFQEALGRAKRDALALAVTQLQGGASAMVGVLREIAEDPETPAPSRVSAARVLLDLSLKLKED